MKPARVALGIAVLALGASADLPAVEPVRVMVLGTYHMANPGLDLNNARIDSVLTPQRQQELAALTRALARFEPTKVMVETQAAGPRFIDAGYPQFSTAQLATEANEIAQIAYRLARHLGHKDVYGIDERASDGEPDYFPFEALQRFAASSGRGEELERLNQPIRAEIARFEVAQKTSSVAQLLAQVNAPQSMHNSIGTFYYESLRFGDGERQPGADLNGGWYLRNAKIFSKLTHIATPADRIVVVFGSGHNYWLRHFVRETPGFVLVEPGPYLENVASVEIAD